MSWTYAGTPNDTGTSAEKRDAVRFRIGDTVSTDPQITDEEIAYLLTASTPAGASIKACQALIAKYSRQADITYSKTSVSASQRAKAYRDLLAILTAEGANAAIPIVGGISEAQKQEVWDDPDAVKPWFPRNEDDIAGIGRFSSVRESS